jgi:hypothetical protein
MFFVFSAARKFEVSIDKYIEISYPFREKKHRFFNMFKYYVNPS